MRYLVLIIFLTIQIFANDYNKVLFISSYNASFPTLNKQIEGIKEILNEKEYQLDIEFMDTKRIDPSVVEPLFYKTLNMKKQLLHNYDVILVGDDNALHFVKKFQEEFFYKKTIVFFAINDISFAKEMVKNKYITGVVEESSINGTIDLIKLLHPHESKITTIVDNTTTSRGILNSFDKKTLGKIELLDSSKNSFSEFKNILKQLPINKPLLFVSSFRDKNKNTIDFYSAINLIKNSTNSPIYHFYEHGIGAGLIGGKVVIFKEQGKKAAILVKDIIKGKSIEKIELQRTENKYFFDYNELIKFKLLDKIPDNSILINKPKHFLNQSIVDILLEVIFLFVCILLWVVYLLYKLNNNSKQLLRKSNEQTSLLSLFDKGSTVLFKWNNDEKWSTSYVSSNVGNLLGYTDKEFLDQEIVYANCIHEEDIERVSNEVGSFKKNEVDFFRHNPYRLVTKNKEIKWVLDFTIVIKDENGEISHFLGYLLDITKEKRIYNTLEKLIDSQNNMIVLSDGKRLSFANKKFYEFFNCTTISEFHSKYKSISSLFVENDRFFHLGKIDKKDFWMNKIGTLPEKERIVALANLDLNICAFSVSSSKFDDSSYLISFTDISETMIERFKLEEKTIHDKLTGAYNREYFENKYNNLIKEYSKSNTKLGLAMLDIDYFKKINDTYGHDIGDKVLIELVSKINQVSREEDILCRWGGEEFILVLKVKSESSLLVALELIRKKIENHSFPVIKKLTCSIGCTIYKNDEEIETTIKRADTALYKAKDFGRNNIIFN